LNTGLKGLPVLTAISNRECAHGLKYNSKLETLFSSALKGLSVVESAGFCGIELNDCPNYDSAFSRRFRCIPKHFSAVRGREDRTMVDEDLKSELEKLRAENEALKRSSSKGLSLRVSEKGAVSVYGLGRFPVTLYKEQWLRLLDMADDVRTFIHQNETQLKSKIQQS
jgi:hypothetical protein